MNLFILINLKPTAIYNHLITISDLIVLVFSKFKYVQSDINYDIMNLLGP